MADSSADRLAVIHRHLSRDSGTVYLCHLNVSSAKSFCCQCHLFAGVISLDLASVFFSVHVTFSQRVFRTVVDCRRKTSFDISICQVTTYTVWWHTSYWLFELSLHGLCSYDCMICRIMEFVERVIFLLSLSTFCWPTDGKAAGPKVPSSIPKKRQELLRWNGWGYEDSGFVLSNLGTEQNPKYVFTFSGSRYEIASADLPHFFDWAYATIGVDPAKKKDPQGEPSYPPPIVNEGTVNLFVFFFIVFLIKVLFR